MITKEKHFTKSETPTSSRIVEDKKHVAKIPNGTVETANSTKPTVVSSDSKTEAPVEAKVVPSDVSKTSNDDRQTPKDGSSDDAASTYSGPKVGTVIPNRIFVGGFSTKTVDDDLWRFFSTIYNITAAKIIYDRNGMSRCYGFITFANPKDAKCIVKSTGGVMFSPMGRLRISQAVRKQMPHYQQSSEFNQIPSSAPMQVPVQPEGFYSPASCPPKPTVCLAYPVQAVQPIHHVQQAQHVSTAQPSSTPVQGPPNLQNGHIQGNNQVSLHSQPRSAPSTSPRSSTAGSSESGMQNNQPHNINYAENVYPGAMLTGPPAYVIPSMGLPYAPSLPAYDATGLYTTCPGYAQPMAPYPYAVVLQPPQREGAPAYGPPYGHTPLAYVPPPPTACYVRDASGKAPTHLPIMNSYIY